ncbi:MAG: HAD-IA family hydrolase [Anaerolineae bacterium]|jgi:sugar-phosphatase
MKELACDALLFDLDGVLIDSTSCIVRHWATWAGQHGLDVSEVMQVAHGLRTIETMRLVAPHLDVEAEAERHAAREIADTDGIVAIEGALKLLSALSGKAWAVVTSGGTELATARLRRAGLPVPPILVTADDVLHGKPAPDPYLLGAERLGVVVAQCVVVEDAPAGLQSARAAGMRAIGVASTHSREELHRATVIVDRLSALSVIENDGSGQRLMIQVG